MVTDVLVGSLGRVFRNARLVARGNDEKSIGIEGWFQFYGNCFIEGACKYEDDVALTLE